LTLSEQYSDEWNDGYEFGRMQSWSILSSYNRISLKVMKKPRRALVRITDYGPRMEPRTTWI